jgi:dephospho-CoA kinase
MSDASVGGRVVAVSGFAGTGKTTAVNHMIQILRGERIYLGDVVLDEVARCGLECTRANEHAARKKLRAEGGLAVMVRAREECIKGLLAAGSVVLVDAVLNPDELEHLRSVARPCPLTLIGLRASLEV